MFELKRIWLDKDKKMFQQWAKLMERSGLSSKESTEYTVGVLNEGVLIASGSYEKNIIKCLAVDKEYQSENLLTQIMIHLMERMREKDETHYFLYTKPSEAKIFHSLGFHTIVENESVLFTEQGSPNIYDYQELLEEHKHEGVASSIVMNANPFTKGHQFLVEMASAKSDHVYVFVLSENRSEFSTEDRINMVKLGVSHLPNVTVLPSRDYMVSTATFPTYFLKEHAPLDVSKTQASVDAQLFKEKIAPILNIRSRFVGEEPFSPVTEVYNRSLQQVFGDELTLEIVPRKEVEGVAISATNVRKALKEKDGQLLAHLIPKTTYDYLKKIKKIEVELSGNY
ncbi:[citrate (pro-3S)-lyase] ligase [Enterococcus sp. 669A]|uniref:[Citrate [pro-3S]-lyase] ligase n=1 Tax=Candidatus Enterococcus moelleringii TaxID=2815325 RepID=A0ABS3L6A7_9ENTE|nr:[citrate (pro-3S)-lyase] ligase [Enterococcus sp. 669A]MBO1305156.1 [citrate (pro-3S)-lyase] ligase [Enterococcus sp. 669A]